ncbi:MAG: hypothetical protein ACHRHE_01795 [Tepidisphaerales bacterium]
MFESLFVRRNARGDRTRPAPRPVPSFGLEGLEGRQLLSCGPWGPHGGDFGGRGQLGSTIQFSLAPAAVQTELDTLSGQKLAATQPVMLKNVNGIEEYIVTVNGTGTVTQYTVDQAGNPVTAPTLSTTTWATLNGTGAGSDSAAAAEITAIATALGLTAPTDTTTINVTTTSGGAVTYSVNLSPTASAGTGMAGWWHGWMDWGNTISVDANGNPVGNQNLPFSAIPTAIQGFLNTAGVAAGGTALGPTSTQNVSVQTLDGLTLYSTTYPATGKTTTVTIDAAGKLNSLRTHTTTTFGDASVPAAASAALQALATADGITTTIASTQTVNVLTEANGTTLYSVTLSTTVTDSMGNTHTRYVTLTVDASGNATALPSQGGGDGFSFGGGGRHEGRGGFGFGGPGGGSDNDSDDNSSSSGSSSTGTSSGTSATAATAKATANKLVAKVVTKVAKVAVKKVIARK